MVPSVDCLNKFPGYAFCTSENLDAFIALRSPSQGIGAENSSQKRSSFAVSDHGHDGFYRREAPTKAAILRALFKANGPQIGCTKVGAGAQL